MILKDSQTVDQLEKRKGGYFYLRISGSLINGLEKGRNTRLICRVDDAVSFRCGVNHLGDGDYFIILSAANLKAVGKSLGDAVAFELSEDPDPLGVEMPEVLQSLLAQDADARQKFDALTDGKKRALIHQILRIKDIDRQVAKAIELLNNPGPRRRA